jgi:hypothetical protein
MKIHCPGVSTILNGEGMSNRKSRAGRGNLTTKKGSLNSISATDDRIQSAETIRTFEGLDDGKMLRI